MGKEEELIELSKPEFWDARYTSEQTVPEDGIQSAPNAYEWFGTFETLRPFFERHLLTSPSTCHILQLGCGSSVSPSLPFRSFNRCTYSRAGADGTYELQTLTADLHNLGYTNQTSVDFSQVVIEAMKSKYAQLHSRWCVMDVRSLELPDGSVDVAIDKGTLDAMIHGSLWDPPEDVRSNVGKYVDEVKDRPSPSAV